MQNKLKSFLDGLYYTYSRKELINPDPLYFLHGKKLPDREIIGLIASSIAYGRVAMIMRNVEFILSCLGPEPEKMLRQKNNIQLKIVPENFKHRFTTGNDINNLLENISIALKNYGSIENLFDESLKKSNNNLFKALDLFSDFLSQNKKNGAFSLITAPRDGSACKRLFLFLKWMVRCDDVDPGGWKVISPSELIVPTDIHMHNIAKLLGFTKRKQADLKTAIEITEGFKKICPEDPARYDFVLTRFGIRAGLNVNELSDLMLI